MKRLFFILNIAVFTIAFQSCNKNQDRNTKENLVVVSEEIGNNRDTIESDEGRIVGIKHNRNKHRVFSFQKDSDNLSSDPISSDLLSSYEPNNPADRPKTTEDNRKSQILR